MSHGQFKPRIKGSKQPKQFDQGEDRSRRVPKRIQIEHLCSEESKVDLMKLFRLDRVESIR